MNNNPEYYRMIVKEYGFKIRIIADPRNFMNVITVWNPKTNYGMSMEFPFWETEHAVALIIKNLCEKIKEEGK